MLTRKTRSNIYVTSPNAALTDELCREFVVSFPRWKLPDTLAAFSQPSTLGEQVRTQTHTRTHTYHARTHTPYSSSPLPY